MAVPSLSPSRAPRRSTRWLPWAGYALLMIAAPFVFDSGLGLSMLCQAGIAIVACLSFNVLWGQGGMLSFGHAVYTGLGAYFAIHVLNAVAGGSLPLPVSLVPLAGGVAGLVVAAVFGFVSTRRAGTAFAMITLGVGELVFALATMVPEFFGGEAGVSGNRVVPDAGWPNPFGFSFGPQREFYVLVALYCLACTAAMYGFTRTPLGRLLNAVRDNAQRAGFIGVSASRVRYQGLLVAGFFAGIAGGLHALQVEIVSPEVVGSARSGAYLVFTVLGGSAMFFGPIVGAVLMVLSTTLLAGFTKAWLLYLGLAFMLAVIRAPEGVAGAFSAGMRWRGCEGWRRVPPAAWLAPAASALLAFTGIAALIEMTYHLRLDAAFGPTLPFLGQRLNVESAGAWIGACVVAAIGTGLFVLARRRQAQGEAAGSSGRDASCPLPERRAVTDEDAGTPEEPTHASASTSAPAALEIRNLHKRFGALSVVRGVSFSVDAGEKLALIGPNGAGKSTLFDLVSGRRRPDSGEIWLNGKRIDGRSAPRVRRAGIARSFQVSSLFGRLSVLDNLRCALLSPLGHAHVAWRSLSGLADVAEQAETLLRQLGLEDRRETLAVHLSYAEQRALELGITVAGGAPVLLLDEPTAGMSQSETLRFMALIRTLAKGRTLLLVEHDMSVVFGLADKVAVMAEGELIAFGTPLAVRADRRVQEAYLGAGSAGTFVV